MLSRVPVPAKEPRRKPASSVRVGDLVEFDADVLRVVADKLLIMPQGGGPKMMIGREWVANGAKLHGGDVAVLSRRVTRIGVSENDDAVPVSLEVEGYTMSRVTLSRRRVRKVAG